MTDYVNEFFRSHYPPDWKDAWETEHCAGGCARRYKGDHRQTHDTVFPFMILADGLKLSVQGHFGAYSWPRDDFAEEYSQVEIMAPLDVPEFAGLPVDTVDDDSVIYPYVPVGIVNQMIEARGGLDEAANLARERGQ